MKTINLQIFSKNEDLYDNIVKLMCRRDKKFRRDLSIEKILNEDVFRKDREFVFYFDALFGEIYEDDVIIDLSLSKATHTIKSISFNENRFTAEVVILNTFSSISVQTLVCAFKFDPEESLRLRPVYHSYTNELITFNIEMITINEAA